MGTNIHLYSVIAIFDATHDLGGHLADPKNDKTINDKKTDHNYVPNRQLDI